MNWWCVVLLCVAAVLADDEWREVTIKQGTVRGRKHASADLYAFYNIPYATAPVGENKFKAPLPPPTWSEPFIATSNKSVVCPQNKLMLDITSQLIDLEAKEDCLVANVFVPNTTATNLSVLVYVHGGGFVLGFSNLYHGTQMMKTKDFIMVTINYRLGIHGFLCLGTEDAPGNAGMKDQVAALRWVQENIASFGGNPGDVTLVGSSAGSASVDLIMLSKTAEGLFHRVIPESGGNLAAFAMQRDPLEIAKTYARSQNVANVDDINALEQFYKTASLDLLTSDTFANRTDSTFLFSPCVEKDTDDGAFLTESPLSILKKGNYKKLPVLYGFVNTEGLLRIDFFDDWKQKMNEKFSEFLPADLKFESEEEREEVANKVKKFYFDDNPVSNDNILRYIDFFTDVLIAVPMLWAVKLQAEAGNNQLYLYEYSFVDENVIPVAHTDVRAAEHCAQSYAWLDNLVGSESLETPELQKMRATIREIWHNFMKTGTPVPAGSTLPAWPAARATRSPYMMLDEKLELNEGVLLANRSRFWEDIYDKYYQDAVAPRSGAGSMAPKHIFHLCTLFGLYFFIKKIIV